MRQSSSSKESSQGLRRSAKETPGKNSGTPVKSNASPSIPMKPKSDRLEKNSHEVSSSQQRSERVEKQNIPSPLRKSERGKSLPSNSQVEFENISIMSNAKGKKDSVEAKGSEDGRVKRRRLDAKRFKALFIEQKKKPSTPEPNGDPKLLEKVPQSDSRAIGGQEAQDKHHNVDNQSENKLRKSYENSTVDPDSYDGITPEIQLTEGFVVDVDEPIECNLDCAVRASRSEANPAGLGSTKRISSENQLENVSKLHYRDADDVEHLDAVRDSAQAVGSDTAYISRSKNKENDSSRRFDSSLKRHRFAEYWVPARLSNLQLEQYCAALLANLMSLRSTSRGDPVGALHKLMISLRKTCSHPFLVDRTLSSSLLEGLEVTKHLDVGIKASGKLQILDMMLQEMKKRDLRVLILYESIDGRDGIGDILDDFLRLKYGPDSFEHVDGGGLIPSKKQAALNKFNDKESGRFVFLLETRACLSSIKLSSVDAVIIHNNDWNPVNDIRALQKIVIDSPQHPMNVFRLFLPQTIEENAMILAQHNVTVDTGMHNINQSIRDKLLISGASDLFDELDSFHRIGITAPASTVISSLESSLLQDAVQELMTILLENGRQMGDGLFIHLKMQCSSDPDKIRLVPDELKTPLSEEKWPRDFWSKLLEGRSPQWKYLSNSNQRNRKRVRYNESGDVQSNKNEDVVKRRRKVFHGSRDITSAVENQNVASSDNGSGCVEHLVGSSHPFNRTVIAEDFCIPPDVLNNTAAKSGDMLEESYKLHDTQKSFCLMLKPELQKLCELLDLSEDVKNMAERFLEYVMENHDVSREQVTLVQAFQLSVCWIAASLRNQKISENASLALTKRHLNFSCSQDEADYMYLKMGFFKELFMQSVANYKANGLVYDKSPRVFNAEKLMVKIIKQIKKKCRQRMELLNQKQQKEIEELQKSSDEEKVQLETDYKVEVAVVRSIHAHNPLIAADKLKALEDQYSKKLEEHKNNMDIRIKNLEDKHSSEKDIENEVTSNWKEDIVKEQVEILCKVAHSDSENSKIKCISNEQLGVIDGHRNGCLVENQEVLKSQPDLLTGRAGNGQLGISDRPTAFRTVAPDTINNSVVDSVVSNSAEVLLEHSAGSIAEEGQLPSGQATNSAGTLAAPVASQQLSPSANLIPGSSLFETLSIDVPQLHSSDNTVSIRYESEAPSTDTILPLPSSPSAPDKEVDMSSPVEFPSLQAENGLPTCQLNVEVPATEEQPELPSSTIAPIYEQSDSDIQLDQSLLLAATDRSVVEPSAAEPVCHLSHTPLVDSSPSQINSSLPLLEVQPSRGIGSTPNVDAPNIHIDNNIENLNLSPLPSTIGVSCNLPTDIAIRRSTSLPGPRGTHALSTFANGLFPGASIASTVPSRAPTPSYVDPFLGELERIQKEADHFIKIYDELKQQLSSECEKEIEEMVAQIRKKYETKNLELDAAFACKKKELDAYHSRFYMNRMLAEAFRNKCMDPKVAAPPGMLQDNMQHQMPRPALESAQRMVPVASSAVQTSGNLQATQSLMHTRGPTAPSPSSAAPTSRNLQATQNSLRPSGLTAAAKQNSLRPGGPAASSSFSNVQTSGTLPTTRNPMHAGVTISTSPVAPLPRSTTSTTSSSGLPPTSQCLTPPTRNSTGTSPTVEATVSRPVQVVNHSSAVFSSNSSRPISTTSITPPTLNLHSVSGIRAPPPHLRSRVSQSLSPSNTFSARPPISTHPQYSNVSLKAPSITMGSVPALQMPSEIENRPGNGIAVNVPHSRTDVTSNRPHPQTQIMHPPTLANNNGRIHNAPLAPVSARAEVVCLSDD